MTTGAIRTFQGTVAIITGGASGIGRAIGLELARRGAAEIVIADLQTELAEATAEEIRGLSSRATVVPLDVRDGDAVERMFADVQRSPGRIDYVFNNAGTGVMGETELLEKRDWDLTIDINVGGVVNVVRAAYPRLIAQGYGHLVNTASMAGLVGSPFLSAYVATKHFVVGLSKSMRVEAAHHGVRVTRALSGRGEDAAADGRHDRPLDLRHDRRAQARMVGALPPGRRDVFARADARRDREEPGRSSFCRSTTASASRSSALIPGLEEKVAAKIFAKTLSRLPGDDAGGGGKDEDGDDGSSGGEDGGGGGGGAGDGAHGRGDGRGSDADADGVGARCVRVCGSTARLASTSSRRPCAASRPRDEPGAARATGPGDCPVVRAP